MRTKEVEDAIDKTNQLQQAIKEKGKKFCFYDNENAVIGYECLKTLLAYISVLEKENEYNCISKDKIRNLKEKYEKKCAVLGKHSDNFQWYEMGKIFGKAELCEELLGGQ